MIPTIHLHLHREVVRIRVWTDADGLVLASLGQGLGEVALRLRQDSAAALALAIARALRMIPEAARADAGIGGLPAPRQPEITGRRDLSTGNAQAGRPVPGKEVLR